MSIQSETLVPLTRRELYNLAEKCRDVAHELAQHDQNRVSLKHCYEFNRWLFELRSYDLLASELTDLKAARPIARWQVMVVSALFLLLIALVLPGGQVATYRTVLLATLFFLLFCLYLIPERVYGTTIELLEGKVLFIVDLLEKHLSSDVLEFSEAAFHKVKQDLHEARLELRQQIDLAYRARRGQLWF